MYAILRFEIHIGPKADILYLRETKQLFRTNSEGFKMLEKGRNLKKKKIASAVSATVAFQMVCRKFTWKL